MKKRAALGLALLSLAVPGLAFAGYTGTVPVTINTSLKYAEGASGSARAGADSNQTLMCWTVGKASGDLSGACYARDAAGAVAYCTFNNRPALAAAVGSMNGDSYVKFTWIEQGTCDTIMVMNGSYLPPKI